MPTTPTFASHTALTANHKFAILDTGAEISAFCHSATTPPTGVSTTTIVQPNGAKSKPTGTRQYTVGGIPFLAHMFNPIHIRNPLLSANDICSQGATITLESTGATIRNSDGKLLLYAPKNPSSRLWSLPIVDTSPNLLKQNPSTPQCTLASIVTNSTHAEKTAYASASMGSPPDSSLLAAFSKGYIDMLGITPKMVRQNRPNAIATAQGHLKLHKKGLQSTKLEQPRSTPNPSALPASFATNLFSASDIAGGKFPVVSTSGNQYIMVTAYKNYIHLHAIPLLTGPSLQQALAKTLEFFASHGHMPIEHRMDNQTSKEIFDFLTKNLNLRVQYYPPGVHRANPAERHIQTTKDHLISMLNACHPEFPKQLWDRLLDIAEIQLNLLRPFGPDPSVSAYEGIRGKYDFKAHPLHPPGSRVMVYEPTRTTWANRSTAGFYLGPAPGHYRCSRIYNSVTGHERISGTFHVFPTKLRLPGSSRADTFEAALSKAMKTGTQHLDLIEATQKLIREIQHHPLAATAILDQELSPIAPDQRVHSPDTLVQRVPPTPTHDSPPTAVACNPTPPAPPTQRVAPTFAYEPFDRERMNPALRKAAVKLIGKSFVDEDEEITFQITDIVSPTGKATAYFKYYDIHAHPNGSPKDEEHEYQPVSELLYKRKGQKQYILRPPAPNQHYRFLNSIFHSRIGQPLLNVNPSGGNLTYNSAMAGPHRSIWLQESDNEIRKLITATTIRAMHRQDQPHDRRSDTTYYSPQVKEKLDNNNNYLRRVRGTLGGDKINYNGNTLSEVADPTAVSIHQQSVLADRKKGLNAKYVTLDLKDYYLGCQLDREEYLWIPTKHMTAKTMNEFNLYQYVSDGKILFRVDGSMYGHPAAGRIAQTAFKALVKAHGYHEHPDVPCLFTHSTRPTSFTLIVDDLGIKIFSENDLQHLIDTIKVKWDVKVDRTGAKYNGVRLTWDYKNNTLITDIPNYVAESLARLNLPDIKLRSTPAPYVPPPYGREETPPDPLDAIPATAAEAKIIQQIHGIYLYYGRAVDFLLKPALLNIALNLHKPTKRTYANAMHLVGYAKKYPNTQIMYKACDMILRVQSDASHHRLPNSRSVAGGIHYLVNLESPHSEINGPIQTICKQISESVCASATESEYAALFINGQAACFPLLVLKALGYKQPSPTTIYCDNVPAQGIANRTVTLRRSKAIHTRYNWIRDRVDQGQYTIARMPGKTIDADYLTKIHPRPKQEQFMVRLTHQPFLPKH